MLASPLRGAGVGREPFSGQHAKSDLASYLLITMQALHLRELSIIVACIKYVKDLFCEGGVVVVHPLHCKGITSLLNFKMYGLILLRFSCKSLIFSAKKFCLESACAVLSCLSWCVQPPATSPQGFTSRAYYITHTGGRGEFRCNIRPALLRV